MKKIILICMINIISVVFACRSFAEDSCPAGQYLDGETCKKCPLGHYCRGGTEPAEKCPAGTYQDSTGYSRCEPCPAQRYCPEGATYGTSCPGNSTSAPGAKSAGDCVQNEPCEPGYDRNSYGVCSETNVGWYKNGVLSSNCPQGTYGIKSGAISKEDGCAECPVGHYCTGAYSIHPCPTGKTSPAGSKSVSDCVDSDIPAVTSCAPGYYLSGDKCAMCKAGKYCPGGTESAKDCPAGTYSVKSGATSQEDGCRACPAGTVQSSKGMVYCQTCDGGVYCLGGDARMQSCPVGYTSLPSSTECTIPLSCEPGFYQYAGRCQMCMQGRYCPDGVNELRCPEGTYGIKSAATSLDEACAKCPAGTYNQYTGSSGVSSCTTCAAGVSPEGASRCLGRCPEGTVQDGKACRNLPGCKNFANGACQECETGYLTNSADGNCIEEEKCKNGFHATYDGACEPNTDINCNTEVGGKCAECKEGMLEKEGRCIPASQGCGSGYKNMGGYCNRVRWTPAEAAEVLNDDDNNTVTLIFKM